MRNAFGALCILLLESAVSLAEEEQWTRFRGPGGSGISAATTIPSAWKASDLAWRIALPARGHSSPVVWGERIFVTCAEQESATRIIVCVGASDGAILWQRQYESKPHKLNRDNSYAASTPAVDKDRVYIYWTTPEEVTLLALDRNGREAWRRNLGPFKSMHGSGTSPVVFEDLVVVGNHQEAASSIIACDRKTGATRWQLERRGDSASYSTPCIYQGEGGRPELIFTSTSHGMTSVDPARGAVNWELSDAFPLRVVGSPVVASGLIVGTCGTGGEGKRLVAVRPGSKARGVEPQLAYELKRSVPYVPTPLAAGGLLFLLLDNGTARCLRPQTGEIVWEERLGERFYGSFVWVDGRLYAISREGHVFVLRAADKFELLARNDLGEPSHATPAVSGGAMYLRTFSHLMAIGAKKVAQ